MFDIYFSGRSPYSNDRSSNILDSGYPGYSEYNRESGGYLPSRQDPPVGVFRERYNTNSDWSNRGAPPPDYDPKPQPAYYNNYGPSDEGREPQPEEISPLWLPTMQGKLPRTINRRRMKIH